MNGANDFFGRMCREAQDELASGESGSWREVAPNVLILAAFGMLSNHLTHKITRPLWWPASSIGVAAITYVITTILQNL